MRRPPALLPLLALACLPLLAPAAEFELRDGDRVVLLGNTLIEREQRYGYWETALTSWFPNRNITFRNLGWSGDTVWGEARASFDPPAVGFKRLEEHVRALKPTVVLVGYGTNESFGGEPGLPRFRDGLDRLLTVLEQTKARLVLLSPLKQEDLGRPLPDPTQTNRNLKYYRDVLEEAAKKRGHVFLDLYHGLSEDREIGRPLTDNGMHLTGPGYRATGQWIERDLLGGERAWHVAGRVGGDRPSTASGTKIENWQTSPVNFQSVDATLPTPRIPQGTMTSDPSQPTRVLRVEGLPTGRYTLNIDGKPALTATGAAWAKGVSVTSGPEFEQAEALRQAIVAKNREYFYRWRPQNETYLFGFRKHEQGNNAAEIPRFDPLVEKLEKEIARLRVPVAHVYEWVPEKKEGGR